LKKGGICSSKSKAFDPIYIIVTLYHARGISKCCALAMLQKFSFFL